MSNPGLDLRISANDSLSYLLIAMAGTIVQD